MEKKIMIITIIIILAGLTLTILIIQLMKKPAPPPTVQADTKPVLVVVSPQPAGDRVTVAIVAIPVHGFVVIYENNNGQLGKIVGSSNIITPPKIENLQVAATIVKGKNYIAGLVEDNGDGLFDPHDDYLLSIMDQVTIAFFTAD